MARLKLTLSSLSLALAVLVGESREVGIGVVGMPVDRREVHVVAAVEDVLRAVAVVVADVDESHPPDRREPGGRDGRGV